MTRPIRLQFAGAVYHVIGRGNARQSIVRDDQDRKRFLEILSEAIQRYGWLCHAYSLMDNHYHLLVETPRPNLSLGMRHLAGVYTQAFNRRHQRGGHLFQGRYKSIVVDKDTYFAELARYIVLNPMRAGLVSGPEYPWSSYKCTAGLATAPEMLTTDCLLEEFGTDKRAAQKEYVRFIRAGVGNQDNESILAHVKNQCVLGSKVFIQKLSAHFAKEAGFKDTPKKQRHAARPELATLLPQSLTKEARNKAIQKAFIIHAYTQQEIATHTGLHHSWVSRLISKTTKSKT